MTPIPRWVTIRPYASHPTRDEVGHTPAPEWITKRAPLKAFVDGQVRTLQRRVKEWRSVAARRLVFGSTPSPTPAAAKD
jgi:hypothetical protein